MCERESERERERERCSMAVSGAVTYPLVRDLDAAGSELLGEPCHANLWTHNRDKPSTCGLIMA